MSSTRKTPRSPSSAKNSVGVVVAVAAVAAAAAAALGGDVAPSARRKHLSPTLTGAESGGRLDQRRPGHLMCYFHCLRSGMRGATPRMTLRRRLALSRNAGARVV